MEQEEAQFELKRAGMTSKVATMKKMRLCEKDKEYRLYAEVRKSEIFRLKAKYQTLQLQKLAANLKLYLIKDQ